MVDNDAINTGICLQGTTLIKIHIFFIHMHIHSVHFQLENDKYVELTGRVTDGREDYQEEVYNNLHEMVSAVYIK